jgi:1,2-dihydroxy-3-keto-5-methylthiopentene dioxygenase
MAIVRIPDENRTVTDRAEVRAYLAGIGIDYERWEPADNIAADAAPEEVLAAYASEIEKLKQRGDYATADVIDVHPQTPNLEAMLAKFNREHWHDEDEVRFIIEGRGLFHIHPQMGTLTAIEVEAGDLIRVPRGTWHWFDLCGDRRIRAIRLFQDTAGWTPHYTDSGVDRNYQPICLGPSYLPGSSPQQATVTRP